ncbi:MAG: hypothetical protein ABIO38_07135 [Luteimonas sp.]
MHATRHVYALLPVALSLLGMPACDKLHSTTTVRTLQDGTRNDRSWSRTWKDRAEFKCLASSSGHCNIVVFVRDCSSAPCTTRVVSEVALASGASRQLTRLPRGFKHCVAHDAKPVPPTCLKA